MTPMLCEYCGKNPATIHFTEIHEEKRRELHICEACANERGIGAHSPGLTAFLHSAVHKAPVQRTLRCPHCGITFDEFRTKGRFGCPRDYEVFEERLNPLLDKIHGAHRHTGRLPRGRRTVENDRADQLLRLRRELQEAVHREEYERAAQIRDRIHDLEEQGSARAGSSLGDEAGRGSV
jgi:protein arginine kinase activator